MEMVLHFLGLLWRAILAGAFALAPGVLFWIAVGGAVVIVSRFGPTRVKLQAGGREASQTSRP